MGVPKQIKNSKWDYHEPMTEMLYGADGAVRLPDVRMCVRGAGRTVAGGHDLALIGLFGSAVQEQDITNRDGQYQMWECEVIIIPKRKYRGGARGYRIDQVMTSNFADPTRWPEQVFGEPPVIPPKEE